MRGSSIGTIADVKCPNCVCSTPHATFYVIPHKVFSIVQLVTSLEDSRSEPDVESPHNEVTVPYNLKMNFFGYLIATS